MSNVKINLTVSSTAPDSSFTAKLSEVMEDGEAYHIRDNIVTLQFPKTGQEKLQVYTPGEKRQLSISLWTVVITIKKGRRLRLDLSSSNFPAYHRHPNTTNLWAYESHFKTAKQTIYDGELILPIYSPTDRQ